MLAYFELQDGSDVRVVFRHKISLTNKFKDNYHTNATRLLLQKKNLIFINDIVKIHSGEKLIETEHDFSAGENFKCQP